MSEAHRILEISLVELVFSSRDENGHRRVLQSGHSNVVLARLRQAARTGESVILFLLDGKMATPDSLAALNCYLRTAPVMGRMLLPFDRVKEWDVDHRYTWNEFVAHLGLKFESNAPDSSGCGRVHGEPEVAVATSGCSRATGITP